MLPVIFFVLLVDWIRGRSINYRSDRPSGFAEEVDHSSPSQGTKTLNQNLRIVRVLLLFGSVAVLVASPWFLKNLLATGNPVYPFFFKGRGIDELRQAFYAGEAPIRSIADALLLPFQATVFGIEGGPDFNTSISPLFLALLPGVLLGWRTFTMDQRYSLSNLLVISLATWIIWAVGSRFAVALLRSRHYYSTFPALAVLATAGFVAASQLRTPRIRLGWLIRGLVFFVMLLSVVGGVIDFAKVNPLRVLFGIENEEQFITEQLGWFGPVMETINTLPPDSHIAFFWEPRAYYCHASCSPDVILDRWWYLRRTIGGAEEIASWLHSQGFSHVLIYDLGVQLEREWREAFTLEDWEQLERFKTDFLLRIESFGEAYSLYAIENTIVPR